MAQSINSNKGLLEGVRVLDFTRALAGPFCTRLMCDLGAEVIKLEPPPGDTSRNFAYMTAKGKSGYFMQQNAGKKAICLDLRLDSAKELAKALVPLCDVVIENFRPGVMKRLGMDYPVLSELNPSLVMCSITGYGQEGRYITRPGADNTAQALSGMAAINSEIDGPPQLVGTAIGDTVAGSHAFGAICAALYRRALTSKGEYIDVSLLDCLIWQNEWAFEYHMLSGSKERPKSRRPGQNVGGIYPGKEGYITLAAASQEGWENLTRAMGMPELASDERFLTMRDREMRAKELDVIIEKWVQGFPSAREAAHILADIGGVQCSEVLTVPAVLEDPRTEERGVLAEVDDPLLGPIKLLNTPFKFGLSSAGPGSHAPLKGEHTVDIMRDLLGLPRERILELLSEGALLMEERVVEDNLKELDL